MTNTLKRTAALLTLAFSLVLLSAQAFAWTYEVYDMEDFLAPELVEKLESESAEKQTAPAPAQPAAAAKTEKAAPTKSVVLVNGKKVDFDAYNINGFNYFKLRDIAMAVNGTSKNFSVDFDAEKNMILLTPDKEYTPAGGELAPGDGKEKTASQTKSQINKDGTIISPEAYNISGFNYFKLRDICTEFEIAVGYDEESKTITIDTEV